MEDVMQRMGMGTWTTKSFFLLLALYPDQFLLWIGSLFQGHFIVRWEYTLKHTHTPHTEHLSAAKYTYWHILGKAGKDQRTWRPPRQTAGELAKLCLYSNPSLGSRKFLEPII